MKLALGIDLGTTNVAVAVVDPARRLPLATVSLPTNAQVRSVVPGGVELDVSAVMATLDHALASLNPELRKQVASIGVAGQMHGIMLWDAATLRCSRFISWQDRRATADGFLDRLQERTKDVRLGAGYGCVTLAWLAQYEPEMLDGYDNAGSIQDYLVARMVESEVAVIDPVMAHSFGLFDLQLWAWSPQKVKRGGVPSRLLPAVKPAGSLAGTLCLDRANAWGLPQEIPVAVATGDNPAALYATLKDPENEIALTLGTSAQLGVVVPVGSTLPAASRPSVDYRPYLDDRVLVIAAAMVGGEAFAWLVDSVSNWFTELGLEPPPPETLYRKMNDLGMAGLAEHTAPEGLIVTPSFRGERHSPTASGSIHGISIDNFSLRNLSVATCRGMLKNLVEMMPQNLLSDRRRIVCSGNGIRQSLLIRKLVIEEFGLPLSVPTFKEEAATGAGLLAADHLVKRSS